MLQRTNIYLPDNIINFLKTRAKEEKRTMSDIVRMVLEKETKTQKANWAQSLLKLAINAKGSGIKDLSQRHDYYLYIEPYERKQRQIRQRQLRKRKKQ